MAGDKKIRVLVVDDELIARKRVRRLLEGDEDTVVIGECKDGFEAVASALRQGGVPAARSYRQPRSTARRGEVHSHPPLDHQSSFDHGNSL